MKVRFIIAWRNYLVGHVIDPPAMLGNDLIRRRIAVLADSPEPKPEIQDARPRGRPKKVIA